MAPDEFDLMRGFRVVVAFFAALGVVTAVAALSYLAIMLGVAIGQVMARML